MLYDQIISWPWLHHGDVPPESLLRFVHRPPTGHCKWSLSRIGGQLGTYPKIIEFTWCSWWFHGIFMGLMLIFTGCQEVWWEIMVKSWYSSVIQWDLMGSFLVICCELSWLSHTMIHYDQGCCCAPPCGYHFWILKPASFLTGYMFSGWWLSHPSEKYESQSGWLFSIYRNI